MHENREHRPAGDPAAPGREAEEAAGEEVERDLDQLLDETKRERDEYLELAQRTRADFENYRKRAAEQAADATARGKGTLARELVPVLDNLTRALAAGDPAARGREPEDAAGLIEGVRMVHNELSETLQRAGVEEYDPDGERFDPNLHEALATRAADGREAGVVIETVEKGYRLDGQVLRPAKVIVSE